MNFISNYFNLQKEIKEYEKLLELNPKKSYTRKEIIFAYENVIEYAKENDAYDEIHHHLETINNEIDGPVKMLIKKN